MHHLTLKQLLKWFGVVFLLFFTVVVESKELAGMRDKIKLTVKLDKSSYLEGEPISIYCKFVNQTNEVSYLFPVLNFNTEVYIKSGSGNFDQLGIHSLFREGISKEKMVKLLPGEVYEFRKSVGKGIYSMPTQGKYKLFILYRNSQEDFYGFKVWNGKIKSNVVEFTVNSTKRTKRTRTDRERTRYL